ncbi:hypothetical protein FACS189454_04610 [Planctomycetales bacterium]|nr:hypothetical protein FACS189454_04610 [Planctomycetales bacterium]
MKSKTFFVLLCLLFMMMQVCLSGESGIAERKEKNIGDTICGPRCVQEVLRLYEKEDEDIIQLVREIQYPEVHEGAKLSKIADALEQRGLHPFAMKIKPSARIVWRYPVIVHLTPISGETIGHYVVWLPSSKSHRVTIWNGNEGVQELDERTWSKERSGAVLLTSPEPITKPDDALQWVGLPFYDEVNFVFAWIVFISGVILFAATFRRAKK